MSTPCLQCGTDSVATCLACETRVCNRHMVLAVSDATLGPTNASRHLHLLHPVGTSTVFLGGDFAEAFMSGAARCLRCRMRDGEAAANAATKRDDEATARLPQAELELSAATQPEQIIRIIVSGDGRIPFTTYQHAWGKLVAVGALPPTHELVVVKDVKRAFGRVDRFESGRRSAWKVPDDYCWIDAAGICWPRSTASTSVYAVAHGASPTFRGSYRQPDPRVEGVRRLYDQALLQHKTVEAIKRVVASA